MANEFEKHIAMDPDKIERSEDPSLIDRSKDQISDADPGSPGHDT